MSRAVAQLLTLKKNRNGKTETPRPTGRRIVQNCKYPVKQGFQNRNTAVFQGI